MPKPNTERADPLAAVGLKPKTPTSSTEPQAPELEQRKLYPESAPEFQQRKLYPDAAESQATRPLKAEEERATEKVTAYFTPPQYDRIEELRRQHRKRTGKRLSVNELLRRLVEHANIEDVL